ncbi:hypothetical protein BDQ17DRAFT_797060 [Cyathus striatus]|nr:hypothetical protein BDQ17DRAFT_797060 [Cyathus striatus]
MYMLLSHPNGFRPCLRLRLYCCSASEGRHCYHFYLYPHFYNTIFDGLCGVLSSSSAVIDPWDQLPPITTSTTRPPRDDWEDEDDEEEEDIPPPSQDPDPAAESNKKLWEDANSKPSAPMPYVVLSPSATTPVVAPPSGAFQPTMRILKRPSPASNSSSGSGSATPAKEGGFKEREKRYLEARERIFGSEKEVEENVENIQVQEPSVKVVREPKGPTEAAESIRQVKGFSGRRAGPPLV